MGSPWAPPSAAERFPASMWLNEVHITGNDAARTIEVAAVADAGISYSLIDAVLVDLTGAVVARKNLGAEGGCTTTRGVGANPALDIIVCADWASSGTLLLGGGLALVNNRGTATTADDLPINFVFTSRGAGDQAPVLLGMRASAFPVDQWQVSFRSGASSLFPALQLSFIFSFSRRFPTLFLFSTRSRLRASPSSLSTQPRTTPL